MLLLISSNEYELPHDYSAGFQSSVCETSSLLLVYLRRYLRSYEGMMVIRTKVSIFYHVPSYIRTNEGNNTVISYKY